MFRAIAYLIASVLVISVLRSIIGVIVKGFADLFQSGQSQSAPPPNGPRASNIPIGGELKKDPVCGTFISTASAIHKRVGGETYYFCSTECRDKFKG